MLIHSVFFWLDKKLTSAQKKEFEKALEGLSEIEVVENFYLGPPAPTERPAVDRTYDYALTAILNGMEAHDLYQSHPVHQDFLKKYASFWIKVTIYDFLS